MKIELGETGCYIRDHGFRHRVEIPVSVAVAWVKNTYPETPMCAVGTVKAKNLTIGGNKDTDANGNGWLNKRFVVVGHGHGEWFAVNNHDGKFSIYTKEQRRGRG